MFQILGRQQHKLDNIVSLFNFCHYVLQNITWGKQQRLKLAWISSFSSQWLLIKSCPISFSCFITNCHQVFPLKGPEFRQGVKCFGLRIGPHCTELYTFCPFPPTPCPLSPRSLGEFPEGHLLTAPASQPQDTPQLSSKDKAWWDYTCVGKYRGIICLHDSDFRFYVRCPCHLNSGAFPRCGYISGLSKSGSPSTLGFSPAHWC